MNYLHTMLRIKDIESSLNFFCKQLGFQEVRRYEHEKGRFTLIFLATKEDLETTPNNTPMIELTYNWDTEDYTGGRNFGHIAYSVENIHKYCQKIMDAGVSILRPPRDGRMAFIKSPDGISIEILQKGEALQACEPWISMENQGSW